MNRALVVTWESYKGNKIRNVQPMDNTRTAMKVADTIRESQKRRVDVIPLNTRNIKKLLQ